MKKNLPDRGKILSTAKILFCSLAVTTLQAQDLPVEFNTLTGVGYQNSPLSNGLKFLSMAGGAPIVISGDYMASMPQMNLIEFSPTFLTGIDLFGPVLSQNDEFRSNAMAGKVAYTTPSVMTLMNTPYDSFNGNGLPNGVQNPLTFNLKVYNSDESWTALCANVLNCVVNYRRDFTPQLYDTIPANVYKDQMIQFRVNIKSAGGVQGTPAEEWPFREIRLGKTLVDWSETVTQDQRPAGWNIDSINAIVTDQQPANNSEPGLLFYPGYAVNMPTSKHCNFAGDDCWTVRTHPKIEGISQSSGFTTGGQLLNITGHGLRGVNMSVTVDGVACQVQSADNKWITCVTGNTSNSSSQGSQPGQPGLTNIKVNTPDGFSYAKLSNPSQYPVDQSVLSTSFEYYAGNLDDTYMQALSGWFTAPVTGQYRFYLSCDDICRLLLDTANPSVLSSTSSPQPTQIAYRNYATNWRNYFYANTDDKHISDWISLQEGSSYYISGQTGEWGGNEHFTVSVEVKPTNASTNFTSNHPMTSSQIQQIAFDQINTPEMWSVTITSPDSGTYFVNLVDSTKKPAVAWKSAEIASNANAGTFRNAIYPFYRDVFACDVNVVRIMYDASGSVTTDAALAISYSYQISMTKQITGYSSKTVTITKGTTLSTITAVSPQNGVQSSAPLNGTFIITCQDEAGVSYSTTEIKFNEWIGWIQNSITNYIPFLADKVQVFADRRYIYPENGLSFLMKINGLGYNVPECQITSGSTYPITGNNPTANVTTLQNFGESLMFEPVPLEFLSTDAKQPQVLVTIDGIVGLCANLNCDYSYQVSESVISTQSLQNGVLTITGTALPSLSDVQVSFGPVACLNGAVSSGNSDSLIVCQLNDTAVSGDWTVVILTADGFLPSTIDAPINVPIVVNSVTPNSDINPLGGDRLVIAGTNFGYDTSSINVTFADGTTCPVLSAANTTFTCRVNRLKSTTDTTADIIVTINGQQDSSLSVQIKDDVKTTLSVVPSSASPVLKTELVIFLSDDYTQTLAVEDFTVTLFNDNDSTFQKILFVMSVNQTENSIKVKFPGAKSGNYSIQINSVQYGNMMSDILKLQVYGKVTGVSPSTGSVYGGALVTITGENFSYDPLDNPVKIGDDYCYVITSTPTQITCRTNQLIGKEEESDLLLVFLKTSEEAQCDQSLSQFNYVEPDATIASLEVIFNQDLKKHQVLVTGTGFDNSIQLIMDGISQELASSTESLATFNVVGLVNSTASDIKVFTSQGYPAGMEKVVPLYFTPALLLINPTTGSSGGTWITVTGSGFGPETAGLNIYDSVAARTICQQIKITGYGKLQCLTSALDIALGSTLKVAINSKVVTNSYVDPLAVYSQTAVITVDSVSMNQNTISFVGSGFPTSGYTPYASFGGVNATTVTITDANNVVANWDNTGIPGITASPSLFFQSNDNLLTGQYAKVASSATISKTLSVTATSQNLQCSFAGGCSYAIESDGLFATLKNPQNSISVCGNKCVLRDDLSTSAYAVCDIPALATSYSAQQFSIVQRSPLNATIFPANSVLFDNDVKKDFVDTKTTGCSFGMSFKQDYVAVLDEAKIFINFLTNSTPYVDNLLFEGSNDGFVTQTLLYTFGKEIHEGWNYIDYRNNATKPAFNSYRFFGKVKGSCRVTEFVLTGIEAIADTNSTHSCTPEIKIGTTVVSGGTAVQAVTYNSDTTPVLESISPRFGSVLGNTTVTLTGVNLLGTSNATVLFDNRPCTIISQTSTQIQCITSDKPYVPDTPRVDIIIPGLGTVASKGLTFKYVSLWSQTQTWGGDLPPLEGESISIPKGQHLLVDIDSTPQLNAIICEGSIIFAPDADPDHHRTFDAHYIMVFGGYMEVGTEQFPYTSQLTITMHSDKYSPYLPIYGNKVIGVRFGLLEMHGVPRNITWTRLAQTAQAGDTSITLLENTDWLVGEEIVIATTSWDNNQSETRIITQKQGQILSFDEPLVYQHLSVVPVYDGIEVPMQAEVGLLTRNVKFRGDPETSPKNLYGAHIMIHSPGDESSIGRIEYIELKDVGQAFKLGRYPIHFHCIGTVHQSYVRGNAIHQTYNRAVTTHTVHYFRVINNVAFDTMGHTYFVEDGVETNNLYDHNLAIQVKKSNSLLNTDQSPGGFWITNPNNQFRNNAIAGGDAYGYWFDLDPNSGGMSFDKNVCPMFTRLGEFRDNSAHSMRKYGLRLFHAHIPRLYPCAPSAIDGDYLAKGKDDPFWQNPKVPSTFENMLAWKCGRNGAITERTGAVTFKNFKIADNAIAGIEFSMIESVADGDASVSGGIIVGNTYLNDDDEVIKNSTVWGYIGPRTENFTISGVRFYNFDFMESAALGTCSHCFHPASTDSGGRTYTVSNLTFDAATVPRRIHWCHPWREIIYDLDGTLTGLGPKTWATPYWIHNEQPECQVSLDVHDGIICNSNVQVRRVAFHGYAPQSLTMMKLKIAQWDLDFENSIKSDNTTLFSFQQDRNHTYFSRVDQRQKLNPSMSWTMPYVTGHRYRIHWGENNDFEKMQIEISERWTPNDKNIHFMTNFTDVRASINMTAIQKTTNELIANLTYLKPENELVAGDNVVYNQTEVREFMFVINGKNMTSKQNLRIDGFRCVVNCNQAVVEDVAVNATQVLWSQTSSWKSGKLPVAGEVVEILPGVNMILDIETPILKQLTVNGRLTFLYNQTTPQNITLHTKILYVRAGELLIGNETHPYNGNATIKLYGQPTDEAIAFSPDIEAGNKVLAIVGTVKFYGKSRDRMSRLRATSFRKDKSVTVYPGLDWQTGDRLAILPTATQYTHTDYVVIQSYDNQTGVITFEEDLKYYHWGQSGTTENKYNGVDMRGEVVLLTRNVKVIGNNSDSYGGQILVSDNVEDTGVKRSGQLIIDNVEIYNCSQKNTFKSAIRFEGVNNLTQYVTNSVVSGSLAWSLSSQLSENIYVSNSSFIGAFAVGVVVSTSKNVTLDNIFVGDVEKRDLNAFNIVDKEACISICAYPGDADKCTDISLINSVTAGCPFAGVIAMGHECGDSETQKVVKNVVAHSVKGSGFHIYPDPTKDSQKECYEGSYLSAYKCSQMGIATHFVSKEIRMLHTTLIDNTLGINLQTGEELSKNLLVLEDSHIFGETDAQDCPDDHPCWCTDKMAFMLFGGNHGKKALHITSPSMLPHYKIKSYGAWNSSTDLSSIVFANFPSNSTDCGAKSSIFAINPYASDYIPPQNFSNSQFVNVHDSAIAYFYDPPEEWNNPTDCIGFPCTAPSNVVMTFTNTQYSGTTMPKLRASDFQIISDTPGATETIPKCQFREPWNAWTCTNENIGMLLAQGLDADWENRMVAPVYVTNDALNYTNKINAQMDHVWDGFYTGQLHKSQFNAFIQTTGNWTVTYTGTPFKNMRYALKADQGQIKVKVPYWNAGAYGIKVNSKTIASTPWDTNLGQPAELTGRKGCGENRFVGVKNFLEFILTPGCELYVYPIDAILSNVRMSWTMDQFYSAGGVTSFADRVSAALGISASQVKVVAVYKGSVVVDYQIQASSSDTNSATTLSKLTTKLNTLITSNNSAVFGAPVLSASTGGQSVVNDPSYNPTVNVNPRVSSFFPGPVTNSTPQVQVQKVTVVEDETNSIMTLSLKVNSGLLWIIVVLVIIFVSCFCCGTAVFCLAKHRAKLQEANKKATGNVEVVKNDPNLASEVDLRPQYHPNEDLDFDIFANKKRDFKMNEDHVFVTEHSSINNLISSDKKLITSTAPDVNNNIDV